MYRILGKNIISKCLICESSELEMAWKKPPNSICANCGFVFLSLLPERLKVRKYYKDSPFSSGSAYHEKINEGLINNVFEVLEKHITPFSGSVLEIGCGRGDLLARLLQRGWDVTGIEPSLSSSRSALKKRLNVHTSLLEEVHFKSNRFDLVICISTLEHLINPKESLNRVRRWLKQKGLLYIIVPDAFGRPFHRSDLEIVEHVSHFTTNSLKYLLSVCGYDTIFVNKDKRKTYIQVLAIKSTGPIMNKIYASEYKKSLSRVNRQKAKNETEKKRLNRIIRAKIDTWIKQKSKIGIYGTGIHTYYLNDIVNISKFPCYYFDSDPVKRKLKIFGKTIYGPTDLRKLGIEKVIISSEAYEQEIYDLIERSSKNIEVLSLYNKCGKM